MATVVAEKNNGPSKTEESKKVVATARKPADGEKKENGEKNENGGRNRRRPAKKEGEARRTKEGEEGEKKPAAEKKEGDSEKPKRKRNRRRGGAKEEGEEGEKKPAAEKKEGDSEKPKRKRNRRRGSKKEDGEKTDDAEKTEGGENRSRRRRDRRKRAGPKDKAGVTAEMTEEELSALSCVRLNNFPHFLSYNDSGKYFRSIAPLLSEGMQLSYEILTEEETKALGEPATSAKKEGDDGKANNRRELAYKDRFDFWTSPEGAVKRRTVYLYPSTAGTIEELVSKLNATKSLEFAVSDRLKEIPQFTHTEETSTVQLPRALEAAKITWAEIPQYVQKPTSKPE